MNDPLTYQQAIKDIVSFVQHAEDDAQDALAQAAEMTFLGLSACGELVQARGGYMAMTLFVVALTEMKAILKAATGKDKELIQQIMDAAIGGLGKTLN